MADFFLRTKRTEGMASLYTRVKKRNFPNLYPLRLSGVQAKNHPKSQHTEGTLWIGL